MNYTSSTYDLFPQLEAINVNEPSYNDLLQTSATEATTPAIPIQSMYYNQPQPQQQQNDQDSLYYYYQQLTQQQQQHQTVLESEDILFPTLPEQPVYTQYNSTTNNHNFGMTLPQQQQQLQQLSPNSMSYQSIGGESPYSIESDSFQYGQQGYNNYFYDSYQLTPSTSTNQITQQLQSNDTYKVIPVQAPLFYQPSTLPSPILENMGYHDNLVPVKEENILSKGVKKPSCAFASSPSSCSSYTTDDNEETEEEEEDEETIIQCNKSNSLFKCEFKGCTKTFTRTYNLKSHRRTHTDEKPYTCNTCPKAFARQHDRNRHEKLHLGLKPYLCQFCDKSFARQDALNRHLKRDKKNVNTKGSNAFSYPPPCLLIKLRQQQMAAMKKRKQQQ